MPVQQTPPLETAWQSLHLTLEWGEGFGLVFVFNGDDRLKEALYERAHALMRAQAKTVQRPGPDFAGDLAQGLLATLLDPALPWVRSGMPLWLDLDAHPEDENSNRARRNFLLRLNERRTILEREYSCPIMLVLPEDWAKSAAEAAPDLWAIRQPSIFLMPAAGRHWQEIGDQAIARERLGELALRQGRPAEAQRHFGDALALARQLAADYGETVQALEIAANNSFALARALLREERPEEARAPAQEALALYERLALTHRGKTRHSQGRDAVRRFLNELDRGRPESPSPDPGTPGSSPS